MPVPPPTHSICANNTNPATTTGNPPTPTPAATHTTAPLSPNRAAVGSTLRALAPCEVLPFVRRDDFSLPPGGGGARYRCRRRRFFVCAYEGIDLSGRVCNIFHVIRLLFSVLCAVFLCSFSVSQYKLPLAGCQRFYYRFVALDALARDWKAFPDARARAVAGYGDEFVEQFERADRRTKDVLAGKQVLSEFYTFPGDGENDPLTRFQVSNDDAGAKSAEDVWRRFCALVAPQHEEELRERQLMRLAEQRMGSLRLNNKNIAEVARKYEVLEALFQDWWVFPEARRRVAEAYGEDFARSFEQAAKDVRAWLGGKKVLAELYSMEGDGEFDSFLRYRDQNNADALENAGDVWRHFTAGLRPRRVAEAQKASEKESGKASDGREDGCRAEESRGARWGALSAAFLRSDYVLGTLVCGVLFGVCVVSAARRRRCGRPFVAMMWLARAFILACLLGVVQALSAAGAGVGGLPVVVAGLVLLAGTSWMVVRLSERAASGVSPAACGREQEGAERAEGAGAGVGGCEVSRFKGGWVKFLVMLAAGTAAAVVTGGAAPWGSLSLGDGASVLFGLYFGVSFWFVCRFGGDCLRRVRREYGADNPGKAFCYAGFGVFCVALWCCVTAGVFHVLAQLME